MEVKSYVFQSDSELVNQTYQTKPNFLIEYNESVSREYCVLYFSSNDLYYPNNDIAFTESLIRKNRFEWFANRITYAHKHIFLRDIKKQWYLSGINADINSPDKLYNFLKKETEGYKIITLGSSAGGFISTIMGQMLSATRIYSFNGQFEIISLLSKSKEEVDPLIFRNQDNSMLMPYYDTLNFIKNPSTIYYFQSANSNWDIEQNKYIKNVNLKKISFTTSNHGIPFLRTNLPAVLNLSEVELDLLVGKQYHPILFSLKIVGFLKTIKGANSIIKFGLNKLYINAIQQWKRR